MLFLNTTDEQGHPDCSYKGGLPGFVQIRDEHTPVCPDYDGNKMFRSLRNILVNPHVGLLFITFQKSGRIHVNGIAPMHDDNALVDRIFRSPVVGKRRGGTYLPELPLLHTQDGFGRAFHLCTQLLCAVSCLPADKCNCARKP